MAENGSYKIDDAGYELVLSFPDQSPSFVHGFEAGGLWNRMRSGHEAEIDVTTHVENRALIQRMATVEGWTIECVPSEVEGWDFTKLQKAKTPPAKPNPHGLRAV